MHSYSRIKAFGWATLISCLLGFATSQAAAQSPFDDAVAYWAFEETGDTIVDSNGLADMHISDDIMSPTRVSGLVGGALQVNHGDEQYITTGDDVDALDFDSRDDFSVAGWVWQYEGSPVFIKMANTSADNYRGWCLEAKDDGRITFLLRSTNASTDKIEVYGDGRIPMGEWTHLVATYHYDAADPTLGVRIYVNGSLYNSHVTYNGLATPMDTTNAKPFQFTAREGNEYLGTYDTTYDEVGVWNRALSQSEVQQLVNAAVPDVPVEPGVNYIQNGNFEDTTGWVPAGTGVLPPAEWNSHIWKNNPADQAVGAAAIGGGTSALMVGALLSGSDQRGMAQTFVHETDSEWQFDLDFATNAPSNNTQRTFAMTLRANNGAQLAFVVSDPDNDGMGDLMVGGVTGSYETIAGLENSIVFDSDLSDLTGAVHHLKINGHFGDATPNWDITLTDPYGTDYSALGQTTYSGDMADLTSGLGVAQVGFYTYKSYGDWVIDNVSLVNVASTPHIPGDADGNGFVDEVDAAALAANWGMTTGAAWSMGDFTGEGAVNAADAAILAANWNPAPPPMENGATVPEPTGLALLLSFVLATLPRRHTRG